MILSFPADAWLLLIVAVGLGLGLEFAFYLKHSGREPDRGAPGRASRAGRFPPARPQRDEEPPA